MMTSLREFLRQRGRLLSILGLFALVAMTGTGVAQDPDDPPPPDEIDGVRADLNMVIDDYEHLCTEHGIDDAMPSILAAREKLAAATDEEIKDLVAVRDQAQALAEYVRVLDEILDDSGIGWGEDEGFGGAPGEMGKSAAGGAGGKGAAKTLPSRNFGPFPRAQYNAICGNPNLDATALHIAWLTFEVARLVADIALDACNQLIVAVGGSNTSLACIITNTIFNVADIVFSGLMFCDDDAAQERLEAIFYDTEHLHIDIEQMQTDVDFIKDAVTCRPVVPLRRGSGCNGNDDDCDPLPPPRTIDECDEDIFAPLVYIPAAVSAPWYASLADARQAVTEAVVAIDDCQTVTVTTPTLVGTCDAVVASVTATDACGNARTVTLTLKVDGTPPRVTIPPSLEGTCFTNAATAEAAILQQTVIQDDCAARSELKVRVDSQAEDCSLRVRIEATNRAGLSASDAITVRVDPNSPIVRIDSSVSNAWYSTVGEALAAIMSATHVTDECNDVVVDAPVLTGTCGSVTARVAAHDACGNNAVAQADVRIDSAPPTVTLPPSANGRCFPSVDAAEQYVRSQALIIDDCSVGSELDVRVSSSVSDCSLRVVVQATDMAGRVGSAGVTVRVDGALPAVTIDRLALGFKGDPLGFQTPTCWRTTAEAMAAVLAATSVSDNCPGAGAPTITSFGNPCSLRITARASDTCGGVATDDVTVRVDGTAPMVTTSLMVNRLSPADKRMVDVGFNFMASDACGPPTTVVTVTSDESTWGGGVSPAPDAEVRWDANGIFRGVRLRAECEVPGNGRVYKITAASTDACGNTSTSTVTVNVPNTSNQNIDSGQYYDASAVN